MKTFSPTLRTHCVGRYLIDLPEDMGEPSVDLAQFYYGLDKNFKKVEAYMPQGAAMEFDEFRRRVTVRMDELKTKKNSELEMPLLVRSEIVPTPNGDALLLRRLGVEAGSPSTVISEVHAYVNNRHIRLEAESFPPDEMYSKGADPLYPYADPQPSEDRLKHMVRNLRAAKAPLRAGEGFCMNGIVFDAQRIGYDEEKAVFEFQWPQEKGWVKLDVDMMGKTGQGKETLSGMFAELRTLIGQLGGVESDQPKSVWHKRQERAGLRVEEYGMQGWDQGSSTAQFRFSARNDEGQFTWTRPGLQITLDAGQFGISNYPSPLSRDQVEQAWDAWLSSLRLSPGRESAGITR
ncbi:MAG: hypothetical protein J0H69_06455 [Burkholderiales bacterium]|nr:hypothetical protein [Burkholderiales bacterium]